MSQATEDKPHVTKQLVEHLEAIYSDRLTGAILTITDRELGSLVGQQVVVTYLKGLLAQQEEESIL
jgi:hypothetical protein